MAHQRVQALADGSPRAAQLAALVRLANQTPAQPTAVPDRRGALSGPPSPSYARQDGPLAQLVAIPRLKHPAVPVQLQGTGIAQRVAGTKKGMKKIKPIPPPGGKKQTLTVRNGVDNYSSGLISTIVPSTGVNAGPRKEAQKVATMLGGSWVGGHMVNDQLGGDGGYGNIVPITSSMNGMHKTIENLANNLLTAGHGTSVEYKMDILRRATVKYSHKTVKNLPVEFQQTLIEHPALGASKTHHGAKLVQGNPGHWTII